MTEFKIKTVQIENSSMILRADYDPFLESLKVYFKSGAIYEYYGVPEDVMYEMKKAESAGKYFNENIKKPYEHMKKSGAPNVNKTQAAEEDSI